MPVTTSHASTDTCALGFVYIDFLWGTLGGGGRWVLSPQVILVCVAGLGIYSDSDSEGEASGGGRGDTDSDEELRQTIRRKRRDFQVMERDILQRLQTEEMAERAKKSHAQESESDEEGQEQTGLSGQDSKVEGEADKASDHVRLHPDHQQEEEVEGGEYHPPVMGE